MALVLSRVVIPPPPPPRRNCWQRRHHDPLNHHQDFQLAIIPWYIAMTKFAYVGRRHVDRRQPGRYGGGRVCVTWQLAAAAEPMRSEEFVDASDTARQAAL